MHGVQSEQETTAGRHRTGGEHSHSTQVSPIPAQQHGEKLLLGRPRRVFSCLLPSNIHRHVHVTLPPLHCLHGARSQRRAERIADERTRVRSADMDHRRQRAGCPPVGTDRPGGARRRRRCRLTYVRQACPPAGPPAGVESASAGADPHRRTEAARSGPADRIGSDHGISVIIRRSCRGSAWSARLRAARAPPLTAARS